MRILKKSSFAISIVCLACITSSAASPSKEESIFIEQIKSAHAQNDIQGFFTKLFKYIKAFPQGEAVDHFLALAGDIFYTHNKYAQAIKAYKKVHDQDVWKTIELNFLLSNLALEDHESVLNYLYSVKNITTESQEVILRTINKVSQDQSFDKNLLSDYLLYGISIYESYPSEEHDLNSLQDLSRYYLLTGQFSKAAATLYKTIELDQGNNEKTLLQIANIQSKYDTNAALTTFSEVVALNGRHKTFASYNQLKLLLKKRRFNEIILLKEAFSKNLDKKNIPFLHFSLGAAYFANKEYSQSENELMAFLNNVGEYHTYEEEVLDALVNIAETQNKNVLSKIELKYISFNLEKENHEKIIQYVLNAKKLTHESKELLLSTISKFSRDKNFDQSLMKDYLFCGIFIYESDEAYEYDLNSLRTLSQYYLATNQLSKAVSALKKTIYLDPRAKEKTLLNVAKLQMEYDRQAAYSTLSEVVDMQGKLAALAAHKQLEVLFEESEFEKIIELKDEFLSNLDSSSMPFFHYALGMSYLAYEEYQLSENEFAAFLEDVGSYQVYESEVKDTLVAIYEFRENIRKEVAKRELVVSPEEKSYFYDAIQEYKNNKEYDKAKIYLRKLLLVATAKEKRALYFELAIINFESENYLTSRKQFEEFLIDYPKSPLAALAWDYFIQSSIQLANDSKYPFAKAQLIFDLEILLEKNVAFMNVFEVNKYLLLLGQTQYATKDYEAAISTFVRLINQNPNQNILSKAYVLLAYSYHYGLGDQEKYSVFIQKALELQPDLEVENYSQQELTEKEEDFPEELQEEI
ncbi:MAG: hypothetical protein PVI40_03065 [Chlamydiota bacterium]|jgi:tetratricopeptide (TPR) repeat protein